MSCRPAECQAGRLLAARDAGSRARGVADAAQALRRDGALRGIRKKLAAPRNAGPERAVDRRFATSVQQDEWRAAAVMAGLELRAKGRRHREEAGAARD